MRTRIFALSLVLLLSSAMWAAKLRQIAMVELPGRPGFGAMAVANGNLLIAHPAAGTLDVFNLARRRSIAQVKNLPGATGVAVDENSGAVYVAIADSKVAVLDGKSWDRQGTLALSDQPDQLLYVPEQKRLYVSSARNQSITAVNPEGGKELGKVEVGGRPSGMVFDAARNLLFVTIEDQSQVLGIDEKSSIVQRFPLKASEPTGIAIDPKAGRLYVAVRFAVITLDAATGTEIGRTAAPQGVTSVWFDPQTQTVFTAAGGTVDIMKTRSGGLTRESELNVDVKGHTLAFDPSTGLVYIPGGRDGHSKLLILKQVEGPAVASDAVGNKPAMAAK